MSSEKKVSMPAADGGGTLAYWFDIAPEVRGEWLDWYLHDHMPSRVGTTFITGRCYEAIRASRSHMVLFETATAGALLSPSYLALLKVVTPEDRQRRGWYANTIRVTCRVPARSGSGTGSVLGVVRVAGARAPSAELARCLAQEIVPLLARARGVGAVWLLQNDPGIRQRMDQVRLTGHQDGSADWAVLVEAGQAGDLDAALEPLQHNASWHALGLGEHAVVDRFRLLYTMNQRPAP